MIQQQIPKLIAPEGYRTQALDISIEADLLDFHLLRQRSVTERVAIAANLMSEARAFSLRCLSHQFSRLEPQAFARKLAEAWLQEECPPNYIPRGSCMTWIQNSADLAVQLHTIFESAGISYYITGGIAAIAYGDPRTTRDVDIVIQTPRSEIAGLQAILEQSGFYVAGVEEVASGRMKTLQITQIETISRADLMLADDNAYTSQQFARRRQYSFPNKNETPVYLASPEDIVISKLRWGLRSESEKQQRDVIAILKVQQAELDYQYMHRWAVEFDLLPLLEQIVTAAGVRDIADQQWASAVYSIVMQSFAVAQAAGLVVLTAEGDAIAQGNLYNLRQHSQSRSLTVTTKDNRLVACFDSQGQVLDAAPSSLDRNQWNDIAMRVRSRAQQSSEPQSEL